MSSPISPTLAGDPLDAAVFADRALWDPSDPQPDRWLAIRDAAVRAAIESGYSRNDVARALGVLPSDIDRILHG
jgi:hypothetical protein